LNVAGLTGRAVEVGVDRGDHARSLLSAWKGSELHLVDPWVPSGEMQGAWEGYGSEDAYQAAVALAKEDGRVRIHRLRSAEAAQRIPDGLDFVYLDAGHGYADVRDDLRVWYPKIRPGGMIAGHDYMFRNVAGPRGDIDSWHCGVQAAVDIFLSGKALARSTHREEFPSWYAWKPARMETVAVYSCAFDDYPGKLDGLRNHRQYCERWGYHYQMDLPTELHWHKVRLFRDEIRERRRTEDWLFWIDADAVFTNWKKSLGELVSGAPFPLIVGFAEPWGVNTGTFAIRNNEAGLSVLDEWFAEYPRYVAADSVQDNGALQYLVSTRRSFAERVEVINHRVMNSYPHWNRWASGDMIGHFAASFDRRGQLMRHFAAWAEDHNKG